MKSVLDVELEEIAAWMKPCLLSIRSDQDAAKCPECQMLISDNFPPVDVKGRKHPQCPHCAKPLNIQCSDIDDSTRLGDMNAAQYILARVEFQSIGAQLKKLDDDVWQLSFDGCRSNLSSNTFVISVYNGVLERRADMKGTAHHA